MDLETRCREWLWPEDLPSTPITSASDRERLDRLMAFAREVEREGYAKGYADAEGVGGLMLKRADETHDAEMARALAEEKA